MKHLTCGECTRILSKDEIEDLVYKQPRLYEQVLEQINSDCNEPIFYGDTSDMMDVTISLECPNCKNEIETDLTVEGIDENWEMGSDSSETMPEFLGFEDFEFVHYDPLEVKISSTHLLVEDPTKTNVSLLIVVKTRMNNGFCYIGLKKKRRMLL